MFADEIRHAPAPVADTRPLRLLTATADARLQRALDMVWRAHEVVACTDPAAVVATAQQRDVDVVLCDQRIPPAFGVEILTELRGAHPRALRILLSDRPDARLLLHAVKEAKVSRLGAQRGTPRALRAPAAAARRAARRAPPIPTGGISDEEAERMRKAIAVVAIESDGASQQRLRDLLQGHYKT